MAKLSDIAQNGWFLLGIYFITGAGTVVVPALGEDNIRWGILAVQGFFGGAVAVHALLRNVPVKDINDDKN